MNSCIYAGRVRHRRMQPATHEFGYRLFMMYIDLDELPSLFDRFWLWSARRPNLAWFRRRDHLGDRDRPLKQAVFDLVERETGHRPNGPVRLLTHFAYFGYRFNPVSFYYCFDREGQSVDYIVAEVNNTPWNEQHCYVMSERQNIGVPSHKRFQFDKAFHVSPFMEMNLGYDWRFSQPKEKLTVHMENLKDSKKIFDATLVLERRALNGRSLAIALVTYPLMTVKVIAAIHFQALRLWLKRVPFFVHPDKKEAPRTAILQ